MRANNPGDIRITTEDWHGKLTPSIDPDFETFDSIENGIRAVAITLLTYYTRHKLQTLAGMAYRYAPPSENATSAYLCTLCDRTGFEPDAHLAMPDDLLELTKAFIDAEQGPHASEITDEQFADGVNRALDIKTL